MHQGKKGLGVIQIRPTVLGSSSPNQYEDLQDFVYVERKTHNFNVR